jgi:hypothetical protein
MTRGFGTQAVNRYHANIRRIWILLKEATKYPMESQKYLEIVRPIAEYSSLFCQHPNTAIWNQLYLFLSFGSQGQLISLFLKLHVGILVYKVFDNTAVSPTNKNVLDIKFKFRIGKPQILLISDLIRKYSNAN